MNSTPTVHINGTSREDLVSQAVNVIGRLRDLETAMRKAWPNGRDYYPQGDGALKAANEERLAMCRTLRGWLVEWEALAERIRNAGKPIVTTPDYRTWLATRGTCAVEFASSWAHPTRNGERVEMRSTGLGIAGMTIESALGVLAANGWQVSEVTNAN